MYVEAVAYLLECLGFKVNQILDPAQTVESLGLTVNTSKWS